MEGRVAHDGVIDRWCGFGAKVEPKKHGARIGDVGARGLERTILRIDQIDAGDAARARQDYAAEIAPAAAEIGDQTEKIVRQVSGEQGGTVVDPVPGEDAGLA